MFAFGVSLVRIFPQMRENVDQNNSKYGHFLRSHCHEDVRTVAYGTIFLSHSQFYKATLFFPEQIQLFKFSLIQLFKLSLKSNKRFVEHTLPDVNRPNLNNNYKNDLTIYMCWVFSAFFLNIWYCFHEEMYEAIFLESVSSLPYEMVVHDSQMLLLILIGLQS